MTVVNRTEYKTSKKISMATLPVEVSLRISGKSDASTVIKELFKSPERVSKIRRTIISSHNANRKPSNH